LLLKLITRRSPVQICPRQPFLVDKKWLRRLHSWAVSLFRPTGVQNSPNCVAKLRRNSLSVLVNHMRVDCFFDRRAVGVAESPLTQFLRCSETAHQSCVRMTERVEAIAAWHLDSECSKQWPELSFEQQVLIPRSSVASGEEQPTFVRMPRLQEHPQVPADVKRKLDHPNRLICFRIA
jgi:hypothetical protein